MNCNVIPIMRRAMPILTEVELCAWIGSAIPGEQLIYHRGFLAVDCDSTTSRLPGESRSELKRMARRARFAAECGLVHLVQRRTGPETFDYILVVRNRRAAEAPMVASILAASPELMGE